jgi:hypothetical protein
MEHICSGSAAPEKLRGDDTVDHPRHYTFGRIEVIDAIEAWGLGFHDGNVVKYIARAKHKGRYLEDLEKAQWYLSRLIGLVRGGVRAEGSADGDRG